MNNFGGGTMQKTTVNLLTPEKKGGVKSAPPPGVPADLKSAVKKSSTY